MNRKRIRREVARMSISGTPPQAGGYGVRPCGGHDPNAGSWIVTLPPEKTNVPSWSSGKTLSRTAPSQFRVFPSRWSFANSSLCHLAMATSVAAMSRDEGARKGEYFSVQERPVNAVDFEFKSVIGIIAAHDYRKEFSGVHTGEEVLLFNLEGHVLLQPLGICNSRAAPAPRTPSVLPRSRPLSRSLLRRT